MQLKTVTYDHPDATVLIDAGQRDEADRYGSPDQSAVDHAEFLPPHGIFLVGYHDGVAVACGGWRAHARDAELKRLYVLPAARRNGFARALLAELERTALVAGRARLVLETGRKQPEAVALYRSAGYRDVPKFGYYADDPDNICLGKELTRGDEAH